MPLKASLGSAATQLVRTRVRPVLSLLWMLLLILPAASSASSTQNWDIDSGLLFGLSCWLILAFRLMVPARWFFLWSLPIAMLGVLCMGADFLRHANLLDLGLQWQTFSPAEIRAALMPYAAQLVVVALALACWSWACAPVHMPRPIGRGLLGAILAVTLALAISLPGVAWLRAWPLNALLVAATAASQSPALVSALQPALSTVDPRDPAATWHGRATNTTAQQLMVFIVGESVRADFLTECQGPSRVQAAAPDSVVACDVTSGSDATHTSVPLLISRDMPGRPYRVSTDGTFLRAFQEAGFETHWIGDQGRSLAWPDAQFQTYPEYAVSDENSLGPAMTKALARPATHKAIVLHAYNAHEPYCLRYAPATAPYPAPCGNLGAPPVAAEAQAIRASYSNAIDASVRFVNGVIETLRGEPGEVFLVFTSDHGENLFDDARKLYGHALRDPTRWDVRVPAIFWANPAWRAAHPQEWALLQSQLNAPLMHADLVPTFLAAAGVTYEDSRPLAIDLLHTHVPPRRRTIQRALSAVVDWETLVRDAR